MKNFFTELNSINVNEHVELKQSLRYLSWSWAWTELKKRYPLSYSIVHESPEGLLIWKDPIGAHVKTTVVLVYVDDDGNRCEQAETEYLPVFDFRMKVVPYENIDAMMINKTIQRSLTKCIARLGLGCYIYAGEDLPEETEEEKERKLNEAKVIADLVSEIDKEIKRVTGKMTQDEKKEFAANYIVSTIGQVNYKICKDANKLAMLLAKVKEIK